MGAVLSGLTAFTSRNTNQDFKIVKDYLIELPTYKSVDYNYAQQWFKTQHEKRVCK